MKYGVLLAVGALALVACHGDRNLPPGPSMVIEDGNHNGNAFFYWLAPLVNQSAPAGQVFSKQLTPTITVTNLCTGSVIRTFSGSDVQLEAADYHANWHTPDDNLDPACNYRLTASVGSQQLGVADVDVVDNGSELKNVNTDEYIPLTDDRTLPIKFFVGVGSLCDPGVSDCGEGVVRPGVNTTIVTTSGHAGVFIPGDAVSDDVTVTIQSVDNPPAGGCIPGLPQQYSGTPKVDNACYDYHGRLTSGPADQTGRFIFNKKVTVGICPSLNAVQGDHATLDLLQLFQYDDLGGGNSLTQALNNVPAPFLTCDPQFVGSRSSVWGDLGRTLAHLIGPRPLSASTRSAMFDMGAGGSADGFSRFSWALPTTGAINFDVAPDLSPIASGASVNSAYSHLGVTFTSSSGIGLCAGTTVYARSDGAGNNTVSLCPDGAAAAFSDQTGVIIAQFTVPVDQVCLDATPLIPQVQILTALTGAFLQAAASDGSVIDNVTATATQQTQHLCIQHSGIASVRFAGAGSLVALFDNFSWSRAAPQ